MATVHVVGAGLAGLAAALELAEAGRHVRVYEAAGAAGGRCRSFPDPALGIVDNGAHVLVGANQTALSWLERLGTRDRLRALDALPFVEPESGRSWALLPSPLGLLRVPGVGLGDLPALLRLVLAGPDRTIAAVLAGRPALFRRCLGPLAVAVLNTPPETASARLLGQVLRLTLVRGGEAARVQVPDAPLSELFVDPAVRRLRGLGADIAFHARLRALERQDGRVAALCFGNGEQAIGPGDLVVLAAPWHAAAQLLPELAPPPPCHGIVNLHVRTERPLALAGGQGVLGLIGTTAEWLFARGRSLTVTVSAADRLLAEPPEAIADRLWAEVRPFLDGAPEALPPHRVVKERRATFAQTPEVLARRKRPDPGLANLVLAGDWTACGLPATIEAALQSGGKAARRVLTAGR